MEKEFLFCDNRGNDLSLRINSGKATTIRVYNFHTSASINLDKHQILFLIKRLQEVSKLM